MAGGSSRQAHELALAQVEAIIAQGGYDQELSLEALDDQAGDSSYDVAYVLCAYSVSMEQLGTSQEDMARKALQPGRQAVPRHL